MKFWSIGESENMGSCIAPAWSGIPPLGSKSIMFMWFMYAEAESTPTEVLAIRAGLNESIAAIGSKLVFICENLVFKDRSSLDRTLRGSSGLLIGIMFDMEFDMDTSGSFGLGSNWKLARSPPVIDEPNSNIEALRLRS